MFFRKYDSETITDFPFHLLIALFHLVIKSKLEERKRHCLNLHVFSLLFARELIHRGLSSAAVILSLNAAFRWVKWDFDVL